MRLLVYLLTLFIPDFISAQTFEAAKNDKGYACYLKINQDSSLLFVIQNNSHDNYQEAVGCIRHLSDSTYTIKTKIIFSQGIMENDRNELEQFSVYADSIYPSFIDIEKLRVKYYRGKDTFLYPQKGKYITFYFDRARLNKQHPSVKIYTSRINPITGKTVFIDLGLRASLDFSSLDMEEFNVIIHGNMLKTTKDPPIQCGPFILIRKAG